ncbi:hypothetical protein BKA82DRAFT_2459299 [Pisolithus tinctorius]|nr:hypothetical protein BKA82DRAFT_2458222 [Pisolithus tinctorius]KAI6154808.1 hypothetical protein BKA82DRAFT_2459299 [Pisolithus tinctorius]
MSPCAVPSSSLSVGNLNDCLVVEVTDSNVVCATASRFDRKRPELYGQLMQYAQLAAGTALILGPQK